ncbi:MAG TPA: response regulator, partial [Acidobacteriota bacterium]|nr:response regulator [Acidobacteriota bacterium]
IVRRLARLLGTEVHCRSRLGRGSVFEFTLPLGSDDGSVARSRAADATEVTDSRNDYSGARVVVVDDDMAVATAIRLACEAQGMAAAVYPDAERALEDAAALEADYYVFDFRLPGIDGLELLDRLSRRAGRSLNAVVLTGDLDSGQFTSLSGRDSALLFKPVDFDTLLQAWRAQRSAA